MDIERKIRAAQNLTPTEQQLASTVLAMGDRLQDYSIKEFARAASASVPSVHRFCKKLGLEGFKELKVEMARAGARRAGASEPVDINFPFGAGDAPEAVASGLNSVYETTLRETRELLEPESLAQATKLIAAASMIDIYTGSHNLYPAEMFSERLLSIGRAVTCHESIERQVRQALAGDSTHVALFISYSGLAPYMSQLLPHLKRNGTPCILIGTPEAARINPGLDVYLHVSDRESLQDRITQFASHIAVQYTLDVLFGCLYASDTARSRAFLERALPYTMLPALRSPDLTPAEYASVMLTRMK